jgi:hypothetical protein
MSRRRAKARREIVTPDGLITVPPGSPKILIHTRGGKCVGIYCDQPAKVLCVETQDDPCRAAHPSYQATLAMISPQTSAKVVGGYGTAVDHVLVMGFDDSSTDDDLRRTRTRSCWTASGRMSGRAGGCRLYVGQRR